MNILFVNCNCNYLAILGIFIILIPVQHDITTANVSDGDFLWTKDFSGDVRKLLLINQSSGSTSLIVPTLSPSLYSLNLSTGDILWENIDVCPPIGTGKHARTLLSDFNDDSIEEILTSGLIYENATDTKPYRSNGTMQLFNGDNGSLIWQIKDGWAIREIVTGNFGNITGRGILCVTEVVDTFFNETEDIALTHDVARIYDSNTLLPIWNRTGINDNFAITCIAVHDLTNDGIDDYTLALWNSSSYFTPYFLETYDGATYSLLWNTTVIQSYIRQIQFLDINNDNIPDLLCTAGDEGLFAINGKDGSEIWSLPDEGGFRSKIGNVDSDSELELVSSCLEDMVVVNAASGVIEHSWTVPFSFSVFSIEIVNIDGIGDNEIVTGSFYGGGVYIFNSTGTILDSFDTHGPVCSLAVFDITNDGRLEIIAGTLTSTGHLYVYQAGELYPNPNSNPIPGFLIAVTVITIVSTILIRKIRKR